MSTLQKRRHYIWREYLRAWADNGYIWTHFKKLNKVERPNLMGVGQENYFYELIEISSEEEEKLKKFIERTVDPSIKDLCFDFISSFTIPSKLKRIFKSLAEDPSSRDEADKLLREMEVNTMEKAHTMFENAGKGFIKCRSIKDLESYFETEENFFNSMIFICFQYFRTKKVRDKYQLILILNSFQRLNF